MFGESAGANLKGERMPNNDPFSTTGTYGDQPGRTGTTYPGSQETGTTEGLRERVSDITHQAREKANEFGRRSADTIDRNLDAAAGKLRSTANSLRERAGSGTDKISNLATTTAEKLDATAQYFRDHHTRDMVSGVGQLVRKNPGASLCAALAIGFLLGAAMKRDRY
jgi:ElaB/YqjD/DUF883 family membrane-anchored ribosome-binding protein